VSEDKKPAKEKDVNYADVLMKKWREARKSKPVKRAALA